MMLVQWDEEDRREIGTIEELDALLDELDATSREEPLPYAVTLWTGYRANGDKGMALTLVVGTESSPVEWTAPEPPYARASWNGGTAEEPYFVANWGGQWSELDAWMPVPIADAREAARRFFGDGGACPDNVTWYPEPEACSAV
jgi:hypothetical protein